MFPLAGSPNSFEQPPPLPRLIDLLLAEQQTLPAVERFAQWHDTVAEAAADHTSQIAYRSLIPLSLPGPGEQYAFEVDLDVCSGCKACVTACHSLNGLEEHETWRDVGLLLSGDDRPSLQYVTTACHHCVEPACLAGCPVKAYDKDPVTGIVRHLDDQCIGCQYCVLMCPYDVPKYSHSKGIVRKCDMCRQRLAADAPPACVAACPNQAIRITTVKKEDALLAAQAGEFLASAPHPSQTKPTTRYITADADLATWHAADAAHLKPAHAHWPLVVMLILTQASVGVLLADRGLALLGDMSWTRTLLWTSLIVGGIGGQIAVLHLGRPFGAWRAWIGLGTSWLSREIVLFGAYTITLAGAALLGWSLLSWAALLFGISGVVSSAMIYVVTQRPAWRLLRTGAKFLLTTLVVASTAAGAVDQRLWPLAMSLVVLKLLVETAATWHSIDKHGRVSDYFAPLSQTARLLRGPLALVHSLRIVAGVGSLVAMAITAALASGSANSTASSAALLVTIALLATGEILERTLFFASCVAPKMPGGLST
jgi:Fe-S-cluster-containing dehydrogenase component/DMSO reductase anchor subunit